MGIFDKLIQKQIDKKLSALSHEMRMKSLNVLAASWNNASFAMWTGLKYDITNSDTLYIVLRKRYMKEASIPLLVYKKKGKKSDIHKYTTLTKGAQSSASFQKSVLYRLKALDEVIEDNELTNLLQRPNLTMGGDAFWQGVFYQYALGEAFIRKNRGVGKGKPVELELLPSKAVEVHTTNINSSIVSHYTYNSGTGQVRVEKEDMIHWKSYNPSNQLRGFDPLSPLKKRLEQDDALTSASMFAAKNNGAIGAIMPKQIENFTEPQKTQIEDVVNNAANNVTKTKAIGFLPAPFDYVNFGRTADEMQLLDQLGWTFERICHVFGVPPEAFLSDQTFANKEWAQKNWITNDVMPVLYSLRDELNRSLVPEFDRGLFIDADFTMLPEMQEDMKKLFDGLTPLFDRGGLNQEEMRIIGGFEPTGDKLHKQYYIQSGYSPLSDMENMPEQEEAKNWGDY